MKKIKMACLIDDDPIFLLGTKRILQMSNFCKTILVYKNGQKALLGLTEIMQLKSELPDVIFLDLNMPVMDGWEFLEAFVKIPNYKLITIFIVTSSIDPADVERAKTYEHVNDYIVKPITFEKIESIIQSTA